MKQVEAIVQYEISKQVVKAIRSVGVEGVTLIESQGRGEGDRPEIAGKKAEYNSTNVIITVVEDPKLDSVVSTIIDTAHTGDKKDGKIFVTDVKETYDICTKGKLNK